MNSMMKMMTMRNMVVMVGLCQVFAQKVEDKVLVVCQRCFWCFGCCFPDCSGELGTEILVSVNLCS